MTEPAPAEPPEPPAQQGVSGRKLAALSGVIVVAALAITGIVWLTSGSTADEEAAAGATSSAPAPTTFEFRGTLALVEGATGYASEGECAGHRGYSDIAVGAQVTVYDASGKALALGQLRYAQYDGGVCTFRFVVDDVPLGEKIYQVEVAHRGKISYTLEQVQAGRVSLTLGER